MERFARRRFAALLAALLLAASCILPAAAAAVPPAGSVSFTEVTPPADAALEPPYSQLLDSTPQAISDEPLRVIIELEKPPLLEKNYAAADLTDNAEAQTYNGELRQYQEDVIAAIEAATGEPLDVVWRLTVAADLLSAWVLPAQIDTIAAVPGVQSVHAEAVAVLLDADGSEAAGDDLADEENSPAGDSISGEENTAGGEALAGGDTAAGGAGAPTAGSEEADGSAGILPLSASDGLNDYYGAGQRIAIIDTGTDALHRSLHSGAWMEALQQNALFTATGDLNEYLASLHLLDSGGIKAVLPDLAIMQQHPELTDLDAAAAALGGHGETETVSGLALHKVAFGANYTAGSDIDDIAHHSLSEHGSHVAGIAAANRYVPSTTCWDPASGMLTPGAGPVYDDAQEAVGMQGQAPDAQLLVMQVFNAEGAYESDYLAAIQDALLLDADVINLSLGTTAPGASFAANETFQRVLNDLVKSGTVVTIAHGNSSYWTDPNKPGNRDGLPELPYADDVSFDTGGAPGTYDTSLAVAAADTSGGTAKMSDFSSWGVPSSLEIKPEITAPGTSIYSLDGAHGSTGSSSARHGNYERLSGTSMATPQIAGMTALVTEYLKAKHPDLAADDADRRHIAQSLLMSTAVPLADPADPKLYYPVLQQGAGLADASKAITTNAYITMEEDAVFRARSATDGKVKAELGENADGQYSFRFTVHNMDPYLSHRYKVRTDLFTQEMTTLADGSTAALGTATVPLHTQVQYGGVAMYDGLFEVGAGDSVTVTVSIQIDLDDVAAYPAGAYVEGYTWLFPEGIITSDRDVHSIPLLGFCGSWSAPSMLERATAYDRLVKQAAAGKLSANGGAPALYTEAANAVKTPYTNSYRSELLTARSESKGRTVSLLGNPWFLEPVRPVHLMAVNRNDTLLQLQAVFLRNAVADMEIARADAAGNATGEPLWQTDSRYVTAAHYYRSNWYDTPDQLSSIDTGPQKLGLAAGDRFVLRLAAMPEYYWRDQLSLWGTDDDDAVPPQAWDMRLVADRLGAGALREYPLWVDSGNGPQVLAVTRRGNSFTVTVQDDLHTAWVTVLDTEYDPLPGEEDCYCVPNLDPDATKRPGAKGQPYEATLTFRGEVPETFLIAVGDYAGNMRYFRIGEPSGPTPVPTPVPTPAPTPSAAPPTAAPAATTAAPALPAADPAADEPAPSPTAAPAGRVPRTADGLPLTALYAVFGVSAAGLPMLCAVRRRRRK